MHGLHPYDVDDRVERALDSSGPYLRSHGGDVELLGIDDDGAVRLRLLGHCDGCAGSTATLYHRGPGGDRGGRAGGDRIDVPSRPRRHGAGAGARGALSPAASPA